MSGALILGGIALGSLSGAILFRWARIPLWPLTGAVVGAAAVNLGFGLDAQAPAWMPLVAQLLIGAAIGASIGPQVLRDFLRFFAPGLLAVISALGAGVVFGWSFAALGLIDRGESMFSLMPGGVGEMVAAAVALGYDGAQVIGVHLLRLFTVILSLPLMFWAAERIHRRWSRGDR